jgi:hypothetical protein
VCGGAGGKARVGFTRDANSADGDGVDERTRSESEYSDVETAAVDAADDSGTGVRMRGVFYCTESEVTPAVLLLLPDCARMSDRVVRCTPVLCCVCNVAQESSITTGGSALGRFASSSSRRSLPGNNVQPGVDSAAVQPVQPANGVQTTVL